MASRLALGTIPAATYLGLAPARLYRWRKMGLGPPFTSVGGMPGSRLKFLYYIDDLDAFLAEQIRVPRHPYTPVAMPDSKPERQLTDEEWHAARALLPSGRGISKTSVDSTRNFINACLWIVATGRPWHMLPAEYGPHLTALSRFRDWGNSGLWEKIIGGLSTVPGFPYRFVKRDSIVLVNPDATDRDVIVGHLVDCFQRTIGPRPVPFKTQRRQRVRKFRTISEHMDPRVQADIYAKFKRGK